MCMLVWKSSRSLIHFSNKWLSHIHQCWASKKEMNLVLIFTAAYCSYIFSSLRGNFGLLYLPNSSISGKVPPCSRANTLRYELLHHFAHYLLQHNPFLSVHKKTVVETVASSQDMWWSCLKNMDSNHVHVVKPLHCLFVLILKCTSSVSKLSHLRKIGHSPDKFIYNPFLNFSRYWVFHLHQHLSCIFCRLKIN